MQIPLSALLEARGVGLGVGYAVPAVLGKLATALFFANRRGFEDAEARGNRFVDAADDEGPSDADDARRKSRRPLCSRISLSPDAFVVGWAMVGRGELGFVMARQAREEGLIGPEPYVASCWALLIATLVAPPLMRRSLDARRRTRDAAGAAGEGGMASSGDASGRAGNSNDRGSNDGPPSGARSNDGPPSGARSNDGPVGERTRGWRLGGVI
jgi:Kef-type K+ transport system membrane component KefB